MSMLGGIGNGVQWVAVVTALQEATEDRFQARVAGLLEAVMAIGPGIGFVTGGVITTLLTPRAAFAVSGAGVLLILAVGALTLRRRRPGLPPLPEPARP
jgi:MFS family permease